jgi:hypothetical protein
MNTRSAMRESPRANWASPCCARCCRKRFGRTARFPRIGTGTKSATSTFAMRSGARSAPRRRPS